MALAEPTDKVARDVCGAVIDARRRSEDFNAVLQMATILDKAGTQQYTGPLDTPDDRKAIPEALRSRVEQAEASAGPKTTVLPPLAAPVPVDPKADAESDVNL